MFKFVRCLCKLYSRGVFADQTDTWSPVQASFQDTDMHLLQSMQCGVFIGEKTLFKSFKKCVNTGNVFTEPALLPRVG